MTIPGHIHVTEREPDGTWEDCTFCSGLEFYRDAIDGSKPATHAEAQAIRDASGKPPTGGANLDDLRKGIKARYGKDLPPAINAKSILTALKPGYCSVLQGSMAAFGPTDPLSKWDPHFDGGHAVYLARDLDGTLYWCDPEAPTGAAVPVKISPADVTKFVNAFAGEAIVAPVKQLQTPPKPEAPVDLNTFLPGYTADVKPSSNVRAEPRIASTKYHATTANLPVQVIGTVLGDVDPGNGSNVWYAFWHEADKRVEYTAKDNIINLKAPAATAPDPALQAQNAALSAQVNTLTAEVQSLTGERDAAVKSRDATYANIEALKG